MSKKKIKRKRRPIRRRGSKRFASLKKTVEQELLKGEDHEIVIEPQGEVKMSDVLTEFLEPYMDFATTTENHHKLLMTGISAWNIALFPEEEQQDVIDKMVHQLAKEADEQGRVDMRAFIEELVARKRQYFSWCDRAILDYELEDQGHGNYYLSVASTLNEETAQPQE
jgi:hypothetical protein